MITCTSENLVKLGLVEELRELGLGRFLKGKTKNTIFRELVLI